MKTLNIVKASKAKQAGFTIIELIVVILLLGILSATALPRFIDVTDRAHRAAYTGVLGGFSTGMALGRAQWVANGEPTTAIIGFGNDLAFATSNGVVVGTANNTFELADCKNIFDVVLQGGRPVTTASTAVDNPGVGTSAAAADITGLTISATIPEEWAVLADVANNECEYYYIGAGAAAGAPDVPGFRLDIANGEITEVPPLDI